VTAYGPQGASDALDQALALLAPTSTPTTEGSPHA